MTSGCGNSNADRTVIMVVVLVLVSVAVNVARHSLPPPGQHVHHRTHATLTSGSSTRIQPAHALAHQQNHFHFPASPSQAAAKRTSTSTFATEGTVRSARTTPTLTATVTATASPQASAGVEPHLVHGSTTPLVAAPSTLTLAPARATDAATHVHSSATSSTVAPTQPRVQHLGVQTQPLRCRIYGCLKHTTAVPLDKSHAIRGLYGAVPLTSNSSYSSRPTNIRTTDTVNPNHPTQRGAYGYMLTKLSESCTYFCC